MLNNLQQRTNRIGDVVFAASRQVWLAGLGAAVLTRDWAEKEATNVFRKLVNEGTVVESRAIRLVGDQVGSSVAKANSVWTQTRATVETVVRNYADTAVAVVKRTLPRPLPDRVESFTAPAASRRTRVAKASAAKTKTRRTTKAGKSQAKR